MIRLVVCVVVPSLAMIGHGEIAREAEEGYSGIPKTIEYLKDSGILIPLDQVTEEEAQRVPVHRHGIEGPNGSGKSSVGIQARRCLQLSSAFASECCPQKMFLPWIVGAEEPVNIQLESHVRDAFGIPDTLGEISYRELCKGYLTDPIPQLIGFILSRNRLHLGISHLRRSILSGERPLDGRVLPGMWLTGTNIPIMYGLVDRHLAPEWASQENGTVPIEIIADRNELSSVVYQGFLLSYEYEVPLEEAIRLVWETHLRLADEGFLYPAESMTVVIPIDVRMRFPEHLVKKDLAEFRAVVDSVDKEVDIPQQIFSKEEELYLYLKAINVLREDPAAPRIAILHNDPQGKYHLLSPVSVLASSLIAESSYNSIGDVSINTLLHRWIDLVSNREIFLHMTEDLHFDPQVSMLEQLRAIHELQPEIDMIDGQYSYVPRDLFFRGATLNEYLRHDIIPLQHRWSNHS